MRLAFLLFRYFPYGGLQRDCLSIAQTLRERGHVTDILTGAWQGPRPEGLTVHRLRSRGLTNHRRNAAFAAAARRVVASGGYDSIVGFDRMPGLDIYYAGDRCFMARTGDRHGWPYRLTPRYRAHVAFERAVFAPASETEILLLAEPERAVFQRCYDTPADRFHLVPPGISRDRRRPRDAAAIRRAARQELGLSEDDRLLLLIGSRFRTKGLDRAVRAHAALPGELRRRARLLAIGADAAAPFERLAARLGVTDRLTILPGRDDVLRFMLAADLLLHPAVSDCTGSVILEAAIAGLPVLCTASCGYAGHVERAACGRVIPEPFRQDALNLAVAEMLASPQASSWSRNGVAYGETADIHRGREVAAELILSLAGRRRP